MSILAQRWHNDRRSPLIRYPVKLALEIGMRLRGFRSQPLAWQRMRATTSALHDRKLVKARNEIDLRKPADNRACSQDGLLPASGAHRDNGASHDWSWTVRGACLPSNMARDLRGGGGRYVDDQRRIQKGLVEGRALAKSPGARTAAIIFGRAHNSLRHGEC